MQTGILKRSWIEFCWHHNSNPSVATCIIAASMLVASGWIWMLSLTTDLKRGKKEIWSWNFAAVFVLLVVCCRRGGNSLTGCWMRGTLSTNLERTPYPLAVGHNYRLLAQQTDTPKIPGRGKRVREFEWGKRVQIYSSHCWRWHLGDKKGDPFAAVF